MITKDGDGSASVRDELVGYLRRELVGPTNQDAVENLFDSPCKRYSAGVLFPRVRRRDEENVVSAEDDTEDEAEAGQAAPAVIEDKPEPRASFDLDEDEGGNDDPVLLANTYYPSAVGISCLVENRPAHLRITVGAARYLPVDEPGSRSRRWAREPLRIAPVEMELEARARTSQDRVLVEGLNLRVISRSLADGRRVLTVSLYNSQPARDPDRPPSSGECFFQTTVAVSSSDGAPIFVEYDLGTKRQADPEQASLDLLYRRRRQFAVGHGCAPEWDKETQGRVSEVRTESVPVVRVPPIEPTAYGGPALLMRRLAGLDGADAEIFADLERFADAYASWIAARRSELSTLPDELLNVGQRHLEDCDTTLGRVRSGIALLGEDSDVLRAFKLANMAVLMQQIHSKLPKREPDGPWNEVSPDYATQSETVGRWRSFQLAFVLMNLASFAPAAEGDPVRARDIVDLIWFPTGGGKTEAYLGLTAFAIFLRRLGRPANGGCVVLMRYTLRLLTAQQFSRAAALICACDVLRSRDPARLGQERMPVGRQAHGASVRRFRQGHGATESPGSWGQGRG